MKAIVTGANGFLGAQLVRSLLEHGDRAVALIGPTGRRNGLTGLDVPTEQGDILDARFVARACESGDVIFHAASIYDFRDRFRDEMRAVALRGVENVIAAASRGGVRRVVLTSSSATLGWAREPQVLDESEQGDLERSGLPAYIGIKAEQEESAFRLAREGGIELVVASPTVIVGPHDFRSGPSNGLILNYLASPVKLSYDGGINVASVRDVADGHRLLASAGAPGETYILGGHNVDYATFYRTVADLAGLPRPAWHLGLETMIAMSSRPSRPWAWGAYYSLFAAEEQLVSG